jgi:hypothetical protein
VSHPEADIGVCFVDSVTGNCFLRTFLCLIAEYKVQQEQNPKKSSEKYSLSH